MPRKCLNTDFNSIKVRLEPSVMIRLSLSIRLFQFHKGTIRTFTAVPNCVAAQNFNSIKVRLERTFTSKLLSEWKNFNSIKVRLELLKNRSPHWLQTFQFHKGTIRTARRKSDAEAFWHFNSIKVRLELPHRKPSHPHPWFQFHKGTIRTRVLVGCSLSVRISIP